MTLEQAITVIGYLLEDNFPNIDSPQHKALLVAARTMGILRHLKEVIDQCGDLFKTTP